MGYDENKDLKEWSKDEVTAWLLYLKGYMEIEFDVQKVAIRGSAFALRTKEDMKSLTGKIVGIHIFNAKEALLKKQGVLFYLPFCFPALSLSSSMSRRIIW